MIMGTTQINNTWIYICLIAFIGILAYVFSVTYAVAEVKAEELEGYEVNFSSSGHKKEIEIVYQYHMSDPFEDNEFLKKEYIIVDLYDIDNDGKKEIIYMIYHPTYCGNRGCAFNILKQSDKRDQQGNPIYIAIRWNDPREREIRELVLNKIKILKTTTLGVHDLLLNGYIIWKWQGDYYDRYKSLDEPQD
jgi:hypothetical protein